jgi:hypothetical protein
MHSTFSSVFGRIHLIIVLLLMIPAISPHPYLHPTDTCLSTPEATPGEQGQPSPCRIITHGPVSTFASGSVRRTSPLLAMGMCPACIIAPSISFCNTRHPTEAYLPSPASLESFSRHNVSREVNYLRFSHICAWSPHHNTLVLSVSSTIFFSISFLIERCTVFIYTVLHITTLVI